MKERARRIKTWWASLPPEERSVIASQLAVAAFIINTVVTAAWRESS